MFTETKAFICQSRSLFFSQHKDITEVTAYIFYQKGIPLPLTPEVGRSRLKYTTHFGHEGTLKRYNPVA